MRTLRRLSTAAIREGRWGLLALAVGLSALLVPMPAAAIPTQTTVQIPIQSDVTNGPSVRVIPGDRVEFEWVTGDFFGGTFDWYGKVEIFTSSDGTGLIATKRSVDAAGTPIAAADQVVSFPLPNPVMASDTTYYFRVTASDPTGSNPDSMTPAPLPSFFTGTQAVSNVQVTPGMTTADISWQANVIGLGHVDYGTSTAYGQTAEDWQPTDLLLAGTGLPNTANHSVALSGLQPGTVYEFRVCSRHAVDGDCLASSSGSFTTLSALADAFLQPLDQSTDAAQPLLNTGKNGKVVSVKVQISQGGTALTNLNAPGPVTIAVSKLATCSTSAGTDPVESYADAGQSSAGTNQFHYDTASQAWVYGLDTKALGLVSGNCYRIDVSVNATKITNAFAVFQPTR